MENTGFTQRLTYHQARSELISKLQTMAIIAAIWFVILRMLLLGSEDVSNWRLLCDAGTFALAFYLPYRVGFALTGTPAGGTVGALVIMIWMSTWVGAHESLAWVVIITGYLLDFGPCIYRLITSRYQ